jgi:hypothetical protein
LKLNKDRAFYRSKPSKTFQIDKIWIGQKGSKKFRGNSILLKTTTNRYIFIGDRVAQINVPKKEKFVQFVSKVGNSDVPYPYLVTDEKVYFLIEQPSKKNKRGTYYLKIENLPKKSDWYQLFWKMQKDKKSADRIGNYTQKKIIPRSYYLGK